MIILPSPPMSIVSQTSSPVDVLVKDRHRVDLPACVCYGMRGVQDRELLRIAECRVAELEARVAQLEQQNV